MTTSEGKASEDKASADKATTSVDVTTRDTGAPDTPRAGFGDWFDRWPEMFAQRWPEAVRGIPFFDEMCKVEQLVEDDGTMVVRAELPGLDPAENITVTIDDGRLTVAGRREERTEEREKGSYRTEFRYGSFERTVRLPAGARVDDVTAAYTDGILEVRVPVEATASGATTIPITHGE